MKERAFSHVAPPRMHEGRRHAIPVIGFTVNERIPMYNRLREIRSHNVEQGMTFAQQVNLAVNQTAPHQIGAAAS